MNASYNECHFAKQHFSYKDNNKYCCTSADLEIFFEGGGFRGVFCLPGGPVNLVLVDNTIFLNQFSHFH